MMHEHILYFMIADIDGSLLRTDILTSPSPHHQRKHNCQVKNNNDAGNRVTSNSALMSYGIPYTVYII